MTEVTSGVPELPTWALLFLGFVSSAAWGLRGRMRRLEAIRGGRIAEVLVIGNEESAEHSHDNDLAAPSAQHSVLIYDLCLFLSTRSLGASFAGL